MDELIGAASSLFILQSTFINSTNPQIKLNFFSLSLMGVDWWLMKKERERESSPGSLRSFLLSAAQIKMIFIWIAEREWLAHPPMKQQQIKKLYFLIWLDCFLGAALSSTNFFSSARPLGRASWKEKKCCWWTAAISLLHQQPPVINQPSTCLISTYVCFLSIDILTVIISIEFIPFVLSLINQMKRNQLKVLLLIEWVDWWLIKEREQLLPSLKNFILQITA